MKTLAFERDLAAEIVAEQKAQNAISPFTTKDGQTAGWFIADYKCKEAGRMVPRDVPAFTFNDFFLVDMGTHIAMMVLHTSRAGKVTAWEYHKPIDNLNTARAVAYRICMPEELPYSFFRIKTHAGEEIWRVNSTMIMSERKMEQMNIPAFMREQTVNQARQYRDAGSLATLQSLPEAPPADGPLASAFRKVQS